MKRSPNQSVYFALILTILNYLFSYDSETFASSPDFAYISANDLVGLPDPLKIKFNKIFSEFRPNRLLLESVLKLRFRHGGQND